MFKRLFGKKRGEEPDAVHAELIARVEKERFPGAVPSWMPTCSLRKEGYHVRIAVGFNAIAEQGENAEKLRRIKEFCRRFAAEKGMKLLMAEQHLDDCLVYVGLKPTA